MAKYKFGDIVKEIKINVDRANNPYEFYVAGDHMDSEDLVIRRRGKFATDDVGPAFTRIFKPGQILYGSRRTYLKKVAIADFEGICANTTFVLETKNNNVLLQELLPYIMLSESFTEWSVSHSKGSTNPYVLFSDLAEYEVELPSIAEQRVLSNKLLAAQRLKESYRRLLIDTDELVKSPFRKLGKERRNFVMKTKYDDPIFLHKNELFRIMATDVPAKLQDTKDAFLVQCAFGCRVSDFQKMGIQTVAVSDDGIPYVHYIPQKTVDAQDGNTEVQTPIVRYAFDIIKRTGFNFSILKNLYGTVGYNANIKYLLRVCKIDRPVPQYNELTKKNDFTPLYEVGSSKLCRKTHVDMMNKVQVDMYAAGLHKDGSTAVKRYTKMELKDRFVLLNAAFDQKPYKVNNQLKIMK